MPRRKRPLSLNDRRELQQARLNEEPGSMLHTALGYHVAWRNGSTIRNAPVVKMRDFADARSARSFMLSHHSKALAGEFRISQAGRLVFVDRECVERWDVNNTALPPQLTESRWRTSEDKSGRRASWQAEFHRLLTAALCDRLIRHTDYRRLLTEVSSLLSARL